MTRTSVLSSSLITKQFCEDGCRCGISFYVSVHISCNWLNCQSSGDQLINIKIFENSGLFPMLVNASVVELRMICFFNVMVLWVHDREHNVKQQDAHQRKTNLSEGCVSWPWLIWLIIFFLSNFLVFIVLISRCWRNSRSECDWPLIRHCVEGYFNGIWTCTVRDIFNFFWEGSVGWTYFLLFRNVDIPGRDFSISVTRFVCVHTP